MPKFLVQKNVLGHVRSHGLPTVVVVGRLKTCFITREFERIKFAAHSMDY